MIALLIACLCTTGLLVAGSATGSSRDALQSAAEALLVLLLCLGSVGLLGGSLAWQLYAYRQSRRVAVRLASALGLAPLHDAADPVQAWYGGVHAGRPFAIRTYARRERSYAGGDYTTSARFWLRVVMAVQSPPGVTVAPGPGLRAGQVAQPGDAFQMDGLAQLPPAAQAAMFEFVQKGYPTGLVGTTLHTHKGARSLALCDRAAPPEWLSLEPAVLPDAAGVLVHDHTNTALNAAGMQALLDDLAAVARAIEQSK
ncbi:MAG: hypothetical protein Kow0063_35720 [Anaerolineae bacterium]